MGAFTVNTDTVRSVKNFKFRVKWDGRYVAGHQQMGAAQALDRGREHREGGDPSTSRKSPGRSKYEAISLERESRTDTEFEAWANKVWDFGAGPGAESSLQDFRKDVIIDVFNEAGQKGSRTRSTGLGLGSTKRSLT